MAFDISLALRRAFDYSKNLKRISVMIGFTVLSAVFLVLPFFFVLEMLKTGFTLSNILGSAGWIFSGFLISSLIYCYAGAIFIENYATGKSLLRSASAIKSSYLRVVVSSILITAVGVFTSFIIGVFSILIYLMFFFFLQEIIIGKSGIIDSFTRSYRIFMDNKFDVFATMVLGAFVSAIIVLVFAIPLITAGAIVFLSGMSGGGVISAAFANLPALAVTGAITGVGLVIASLFSSAFNTEAYLQMKKKKLK